MRCRPPKQRRKGYLIILFNVFVTDVSQFQRGKFKQILQFADDTALMFTGRDIESAKD